MKLLTKKEYFSIYKRVPRLCVDIIIKTPKGVVLAKRDIGPCKGMWNLPGGGLKFGESLKHAAKRFGREEAGLRIKTEKFIGVFEYSRKSTGFGHAISILYLAKGLGGKLRGNKYGKDVRYFKKIPKNIVADQRKILKKYKILSVIK